MVELRGLSRKKTRVVTSLQARHGTQRQVRGFLNISFHADWARHSHALASILRQRRYIPQPRVAQRTLGMQSQIALRRRRYTRRTDPRVATSRLGLSRVNVQRL